MTLNSFPEDGYDQDLIVPARVEHRVEFGDWDDQSQQFGFWYEFLVYEFVEGTSRAEAVRYLDEDTVVLRHLQPDDPASDFAMKVLVFLSLRYTNIEIMNRSGAQIFDDRMRSELDRRKNQHLATYRDD